MMEGPAASFPWKEGHYLGEGSIPALEITGDQGLMKAASHMKITFIHGDFGEADPEVAKIISEKVLQHSQKVRDLLRVS